MARPRKAPEARVIRKEVPGGSTYYVEFPTKENPRKREKSHEGICTCKQIRFRPCEHLEAANKLCGEKNSKIEAGLETRAVSVLRFRNEILAWIASCSDLQPRTKVLYTAQIKSFLDFCHSKGVPTLKGINRRIIDLFIGEYEAVKKHEPATIKNYWTCLRSMFRKAKEWGYLDKNPFSSSDTGHRAPVRVNARKKPYNYLSEADDQKLAEFLSPKYRDMFRLFIATGLRLGEMLHLTWAQYKDGCLHIVKREDWKPKSTDRVVPLNAEAIEILERRKAVFFKDLPRVFPRFPVFCTRTANKLQSRNVTRVFSKAIKAAGIKGALANENITIHTFRHTCATRLGLAGMSPQAIKEVLGHSSLDVTLLYLHSEREHNRRYMERLVPVEANVENIHEQAAV